MGPVDYLMIRFPGNRFSGKIAPELAKLEKKGISPGDRSRFRDKG